MQRALLQYYEPKNHAVVVRALREAGRSDLIGTGPDCLVRPLPGEKTERKAASVNTGRRKGHHGREGQKWNPATAKGRKRR